MVPLIITRNPSLSPASPEQQLAAMRKRIIHCLIGLGQAAPRDACAPRRVGDFDLDSRTKPVSRLIAAAVLVPIVCRVTGFMVLLTQRTQHLNDHPGQISFPGGRVEASDENAIATALRETREEIGLPPHRVDIRGYLDNYETATGFLVTPVVGFVQSDYPLALDPFEVAEVFEVPLAFLLDAANHRIGKRTGCGTQRRFWVFQYQHRYIWGATAGMLMNLVRRLHQNIEG